VITKVLFFVWLFVQQRQLQLHELERWFPPFAYGLQYKPCLLAKNNLLKREHWYPTGESDPGSKGMKRIGNLYQRICTLENIELADQIARRGKKWRSSIIAFDRNREENLSDLQLQLLYKTYRTSEYTTFKVYEPKERIVYRLPYFPDRIAHHAIMNIMEPLFASWFTVDSYSSIKGKGVHAAAIAIRNALRDEEGTRYCLKMDITKFYPSVDHSILKAALGRKIKDKDLLWLLSEIINSASGLPIGNYPSQYLANFYLTPFDHWVKQKQQIKYYFRYADDLVFLSRSKEQLHELREEIQDFMAARLNLLIKPNYQVFPVGSRSIDFVGYRFYHTHTLLRKSIKQNFARMLKFKNNPESTAAYWGWAKHCNSNHLMKKFLNHEYNSNNYSKS
jgi:RNA-directed DNA polymerase